MAVSRSLAVAWLVACLIVCATSAAAVPFWGAKQSLPAETDPSTLKPGEFIWDGNAVTAGPVLVAVSLEEQRAYVYRNGIRIGVTTVSSGKPGHRSPTGVFTVLQKDKDHRSKTYNNAPMPYTERLTWDGVALHAGGLPGYPSSHGCVHLPSEFARRLFEISPMGMVVVIADKHSGAEHVRHPAAVAPVDSTTGADVENPRLRPAEDWRWTPEAAPDGPVSVLMSAADQRVLVFRNGVEIGRAKLQLRDPEVPFGTHAFVVLDPAGQPAAGAGAAERPRRWVAVSVPGHEAEKGRVLDPAQIARVSLPPAFVANVRSVLAPGATLLVTDAAVLENTTGVPLTIVTADPPEVAPSDGAFSERSP
ncbi:MAG: L,D-transpeptidase [Myxococcota bacterium]